MDEKFIALYNNASKEQFIIKVNDIFGVKKNKNTTVIYSKYGGLIEIYDNNSEIFSKIIKFTGNI